MARVELKERDRQLLNTQLRELQLIKEDLEKAKLAKVPNVDALLERCSECIQRASLLKQHYLPDGD
jgi:hypothetical protein